MPTGNFSKTPKYPFFIALLLVVNCPLSVVSDPLWVWSIHQRRWINALPWQTSHINATGNFALPLNLNCSEFPNSCLASQFTLIINIFQMPINRGNRHIKKLSHQLLCQPDGFILIPGFDTLFAALLRKNQKLSRAVSNQLCSFVFILLHGSSLLRCLWSVFRGGFGRFASAVDKCSAPANQPHRRDKACLVSTTQLPRHSLPNRAVIGPLFFCRFNHTIKLMPRCHAKQMHFLSMLLPRTTANHWRSLQRTPDTEHGRLQSLQF